VFVIQRKIKGRKLSSFAEGGGPAFRFSSFTTTNNLPCEHSRPVLSPRQRFSNESRNSRLLDTLLSQLSIRKGPIKSKQSRTRSRKRRIQSRCLGINTHQ